MKAVSSQAPARARYDNDLLRYFDDRHDPEARKALVERFDNLARRAAHQYRGRGVPFDDLIQVARYGLLNAIDRFDPDRGVRFATFADSTIAGEIKHHFRDKAWSVRVPRRLQNLWLRSTDAIEALSQELGRPPRIEEIADRLDRESSDVLEALEAGGGYSVVSLDRPAGGRSQASPLVESIGGEHERLERSPQRAQVSEAISDLPEREQEILYLRFFEGKTQGEIADEVGVSQVHVSRLLRQTIDQLRQEVVPDA